MKRKINLKAIGALIMISMLSLFSFGIIKEIDDFWANSKTERIDVAEKAIQRAALQCYALEGSYPPDLNYLQENYGIIINRDHYYYQYDIFASNIMPEIVVFEKPR